MKYIGTDVYSQTFIGIAGSVGYTGCKVGYYEIGLGKQRFSVWKCGKGCLNEE